MGVPGKGNLALLGETEATLQCSRGLPHDGTVCRAASASKRTATSVKQRELNMVRLTQLRQGPLRAVQLPT